MTAGEVEIRTAGADTGDHTVRETNRLTRYRAGHHADPKVMKDVAIERFLDHSAISPAQAGDFVSVVITLGRLTATKVTRMRAITSRTAATGPSP